MKRISSLTVVLLLGLMAAEVLRSGAASPGQPQAKSLLQRFRVGDKVFVEEKNGRYDLSILLGQSQFAIHTVVEIGQDYVVLRDLAEVNDTIVPIYSIKSITITRLAAK